MTRLDAAITKKQYCLQALDELEKEIRAASKALKTAMKEAEKHDREQS